MVAHHAHAGTQQRAWQGGRVTGHGMARCNEWPDRSACHSVVHDCAHSPTGRVFTSEADAAREFEPPSAGQLVVKGVRAIWRQSAPFVQNTLMVGAAPVRGML